MKKTLLFKKKSCFIWVFLFSILYCQLLYAQTPPTCSGSWGPPIVNQTFGQGSPTTMWHGPLASFAPGVSTGTVFVGPNGGSANGNLAPGESGLVRNSGTPVVNEWWINQTDHTGNPNGLMMLIDAPLTPNKILAEYLINDLCPNTTLRLSIWVLNTNLASSTNYQGYVYPNLTLKVVNPTSNAIIGSSITGNVPADTNWHQYSLIFNNSNDSSIRLQIISHVAGPGNDLAIDDITVQPCIPATIQAIPGASTILCPNVNATVNFTATLTGSSYNPAEYQWQYSSDGGVTWADQGSPTGNPTYTFNSNGKPPGNYLIRFKVGPQGSVLNSQCNAVSQTASVTIGSLPVVTDRTIKSCYIQTNPSTASFNLTTANITSEQGTTKRYFPSLTDATNGTNEITTPTTYIAPNGFVFVRVTNSNGCFAVAKVTLQVIPPTTSPVLVDQIICIEGRTTLDAGPGFNSYIWNTGATTQKINNVGVGTYWVDLKSGECITRQTVKVYASSNPVIQSIDITNNTATINANGGTPPYQFALDQTGNWQDSNIFKNLTRGQHIFYVKDKYNCIPVSVELTVVNLVNIITPNNDGKNDSIDYSALAYKKNLNFEVYDRYGKKIYVANEIRNLTWDGTSSGKKLSTATYWYTISWNENNKSNTAIRYNGWILVKNRD